MLMASHSATVRKSSRLIFTGSIVIFLSLFFEFQFLIAGGAPAHPDPPVPERAQIEVPLTEQLIVEYYSK